MHVHHLAFGHRRRARRRELRRLLDFDEAHAAHAGHRKSRVIAVVRHEHARVLRRLENRRAGRHADRAAFDGQTHHLRVRHYATAGTSDTSSS